jgi:hypothetical protein
MTGLTILSTRFTGLPPNERGGLHKVKLATIILDLLKIY